MDRRELLQASFGCAIGAIASTVFPAEGPKRVAVIGVPTGQFDDWKKSFPKAFEAHGFVVGRNLELQWFEAPLPGQMPASQWEAQGLRLAGEVVASRPDCIAALSVVWVRKLLQHTRTIPIVSTMADPVALGVAQSIAKPGGNVTGMHDGAVESAVKTVEIMKQLLPGMSCMAWIGVGALPEMRKPFEDAVRAAGLRLRAVHLEEGDASVRKAIASMRKEGCLAAMVFAASDAPILEQTLQHRIAVSDPEIELDGALMYYQPVRELGERSAVQLPAIAARILRGERPQDIPFDGPSRYRLALNLRTARKIGVTIPRDLLLRADQVVR